MEFSILIGYLRVRFNSMPNVVCIMDHFKNDKNSYQLIDIKTTVLKIYTLE